MSVLPDLLSALRNGPEEEKVKAALTALEELAHRPEERGKIGASGALSLLLPFLSLSSSSLLRVRALRVLQLLSLETGNKGKIVEERSVPLLVNILKERESKGEEKLLAIATLLSLAQLSANSVKIAEEEGAIPAFILFLSPSLPLSSSSSDAEKREERESLREAKRLSVSLLSLLSRSPHYQVKIAEAGGIPPLVHLLLPIEEENRIGETSTIEEREKREKERSVATATLGNLAIESANKVKIAEAGAIPLLCQLLLHPLEGLRTNAAAALQNLASNGQNQERIAEAGAIPLLCQLLSSLSCSSSCSSSSSEALKAAVAGLLAKLAQNAQNREKIGEERDGLTALVSLLLAASGGEAKDGKEMAAAALGNLGLDAEVRMRLGGETEAIPALVRLLQHGKAGERGKAVAALDNLGLSPGNLGKMMEAEVVSPLVQLLHSGNNSEEQKARAAGLLQSLAAANMANQGKIMDAGAIVPLVQLIEKGSGPSAVAAAAAVGALAQDNPVNQVKIVEAGAVRPLVQHLSHGNEEQKTRAVVTLSLLAGSETEIQKKLVAAGIVGPLIMFLEGRRTYVTQMAGLQMLRLFSLLERETRLKIAEEGGLRPLIDIALSLDEEEEKERGEKRRKERERREDDGERRGQEEEEAEREKETRTEAPLLAQGILCTLAWEREIEEEIEREGFSLLRDIQTQSFTTWTTAHLSLCLQSLGLSPLFLWQQKIDGAVFIEICGRRSTLDTFGLSGDVIDSVISLAAVLAEKKTWKNVSDEDVVSLLVLPSSSPSSSSSLSSYLSLLEESMSFWSIRQVSLWLKKRILLKDEEERTSGQRRGGGEKKVRRSTSSLVSPAFLEALEKTLTKGKVCGALFLSLLKKRDFQKLLPQVLADKLRLQALLDSIAKELFPKEEAPCKEREERGEKEREEEGMTNKKRLSPDEEREREKETEKREEEIVTPRRKLRMAQELDELTQWLTAYLSRDFARKYSEDFFRCGFNAKTIVQGEEVKEAIETGKLILEERDKEKFFGLFELEREREDDGDPSKGEEERKKKLRYDVFLTHDWGRDELGRDNHARVARMNELLKANGIITWFDMDRMQGNINEQMAKGIESSAVVAVFLTQRYMDKVNSENWADNCKLEFNHATRKHTAKRMIPLVMEKRMRDPNTWSGTVSLILAGELYVDLVEDETFEERAQQLAKMIKSHL